MAMANYGATISCCGLLRIPVGYCRSFLCLERKSFWAERNNKITVTGKIYVRYVVIDATANCVYLFTNKYYSFQFVDKLVKHEKISL